MNWLNSPRDSYSFDDPDDSHRGQTWGGLLIWQVSPGGMDAEAELRSQSFVKRDIRCNIWLQSAAASHAGVSRWTFGPLVRIY